MHDDELWQVYNNNGAAVDGKGAPREEFNADTSLIMGTAHIWFWKLMKKALVFCYKNAR